MVSETRTQRISRNMSTPESRKYWFTVDQSAAEVATWPDWKRAGINVQQIRDEARQEWAEPQVEEEC